MTNAGIIASLRERTRRRGPAPCKTKAGSTARLIRPLFWVSTEMIEPTPAIERGGPARHLVTEYTTQTQHSDDGNPAPAGAAGSTDFHDYFGRTQTQSILL